MASIKSKWWVRSAVLAYLLSAVSAFEIVNVMVSLQYETDGPNECISHVTGSDLCASLRLCKTMAIVFFIIATVLLMISINKKHRV